MEEMRPSVSLAHPPIVLHLRHNIPLILATSDLGQGEVAHFFTFIRAQAATKIAFLLGALIEFCKATTSLRAPLHTHTQRGTQFACDEFWCGLAEMWSFLRPPLSTPLFAAPIQLTEMAQRGKSAVALPQNHESRIRQWIFCLFYTHLHIYVTGPNNMFFHLYTH